MIINAPRDVEVMTLLERTPFEFHLTGSRFFGYHTSNTSKSADWDFFVGSETLIGGVTDIVNWLERNQFYNESNRDYSGVTGITQIWKHGIVPVHIQIVEDATLKAEIQKVLMDYLGKEMGKLSPDQRKIIWNTAFIAFARGEERATRSVVAFRARA